MARTKHSVAARSNANNESGWCAGFAECDMTPPLGRPMAGFGRERYATGILAPLRAQALALRDSSGRCGMILTADMLAFDPVALEMLRHQLGIRHGLDPAGVLLCPSHTHWGPGMIYRMDFYAGLPDVFTMRRTHRLLLELAGRAIQSLAPATVEYTALETRIGFNRRLPLADGTIGWGPNPDGHYDTHTPVLRVNRKTATGERQARNGGLPADPHSIILVGHACHPTSTGTTDRWSPDYPGAMRDAIEKRLGEGTRAMFVMGCGANAKVTHKDPASGLPVFSAEPRRARQAGHRLAGAVLRHLAKNPCTPIDATLAFRRASAPLLLARRPGLETIRRLAFDDSGNSSDFHWAQQSLAFPDPRTAHTYEAVAWILGNQLTVFGLPDEVCSPVGPRTRAQARTPLAMTIGYANSVQCYIPTDTIIREGGYEGKTSHRAYFMPAPFAPRIDKDYTALIKRLVSR